MTSLHTCGVKYEDKLEHAPLSGLVIHSLYQMMQTFQSTIVCWMLPVAAAATTTKKKTRKITYEAFLVMINAISIN